MRTVRTLTLLLLFITVLSAAADRTVGVLVNEPGAYRGYTLLAPNSTITYLIDMNGEQVHSWESAYRPALSSYLLEDGTLLRTVLIDETLEYFKAGGVGGGFQVIGWDGTVLWECNYSTETYCQHHDVEMLPNGNVLMVAWELKDSSEAVAAGRNPAMLSDNELWPDKIVEVKQAGPDSAEIVWEWHIWDHLIQDFDSTKANYGVVAEHPELLDINRTVNPNISKADWTHINAVDYNEALDQIILSVHNMNEFFIIDHSTTTGEVAGHTGGNAGLGGDILYRWGNPENYGAGTADDRQLYLQHDAQWIPDSLPGAGNILLFNNGNKRLRAYSSVDELAVPVTDSGTYDLGRSPDTLLWSYTAFEPTEFYASSISGAQRLPGGNTLICDGPAGRFFEVTAAGETVWEYVNPVMKTGIATQGSTAVLNHVFRAYRYGTGYAGLAGKMLIPQGTIELGDEAGMVDCVPVATGRRLFWQQGNLLYISSGPVTLFTLDGHVVLQRHSSGTVDLAQLPDAVYLVRFSRGCRAVAGRVVVMKR